MADITEAVREGLLAMSVGVGFRVLAKMMGGGAGGQGRSQARQAAGPASQPPRQRTGLSVLGGRRVRVERPRARTAEGEEVTLETYAAVADDDPAHTTEHSLPPLQRRAPDRRQTDIAGVPGKLALAAPIHLGRLTAMGELESPIEANGVAA